MGAFDGGAAVNRRRFLPCTLKRHATLIYRLVSYTCRIHNPNGVVGPVLDARLGPADAGGGLAAVAD
ncbi:hypothetical protein [Salinigranum sp.]|uniref:hypothetical protein n=1 Tax=Salinigranum sp. TaxID=1966351 RepID=UPI00356134B5